MIGLPPSGLQFKTYIHNNNNNKKNIYIAPWFQVAVFKLSNLKHSNDNKGNYILTNKNTCTHTHIYIIYIL